MGLKVIKVGLSILVAAFALFASYRVFSVHNPVPSENELSLSGTWEVCLPEDGALHINETQSCSTWIPVKVPSDLKSVLGEQYKGSAFYRRNVDATLPCALQGKPCSLLFGEVGDACEVWWNGVSLGRRGGFPPHDQYARHYPAQFDIPSTLILTSRPNEIRVAVYSLKRSQSGIRRLPIAILPTSEATLLSHRITIVNVVLPVLCSIILLLIALFHLLTFFSNRTIDPVQRSFVLYCIAAALFLFSFSELPREYLPIAFAGYLHFSLRVLFDLSLFVLVWKYFELSSPKWFRAIVVGYLLIWGCFWAEFLMEWATGQQWKTITGFDLAYFTMRVAAPSVLFPPFLGLLGVLRAKKDPHRTILLVLFLLLVPMQIWDVLIFHGILKGTYLIKFYPIMIGVVFGWVLMERYHSGIQKLFLAEQRAAQAAQVAHDIRSPLTALSLVLDSVKQLPEQPRLLIQSAVRRIQDIANQLLLEGVNRIEESKESSKTDTYLIASLVESMVSEKRVTFRTRAALSIELVEESLAYSLFAKVNRIEFCRILSNLINNSVDAIGRSPGTLRLAIGKQHGEIHITIEDTGCGIQPEQLAKLRAGGGTYNKAGGTGLGLSHARSRLHQWGGRLEIESAWQKGTRVTLILPQADPPSWFLPQLDIDTGSTLVIIDDDDSIHEFWKNRFQEKSGQSVSLKFYKGPHRLLSDSQHPDDRTVYFIDQDFVGESMSGLDLIEKLGIQKQAILVTSKFDEPVTLNRCAELGIPLIPKNVAHWITIQVSARFQA